MAPDDEKEFRNTLEFILNDERIFKEFQGRIMNWDTKGFVITLDLKGVDLEAGDLREGRSRIIEAISKRIDKANSSVTPEEDLLFTENALKDTLETELKAISDERTVQPFGPLNEMETELKAISDERTVQPFGPLNEMETSVKDILEKMAKSSSEEKKALLGKMIDTVNQMDIASLNLALDNRGFKKAINEKIFTQSIEQALENLKPEDITKKTIGDALKSVSDQALKNEVNRSPLDKLGDALKTLSTNEKIVVGSVVAAVALPLLPFIALAALIALVSIGARYAGIGVVVAGEKIKEGAMKAGEMIKEGAEAIKKGVIEVGKEVKSSYKDAVDKIPTLQAKETNFNKLRADIKDAISKNVAIEDNKAVLEDLYSKLRIVGMLQDEEQQPAIKELIKNGVIKDFSTNTKNITRLIDKGTSSHTPDYRELDELMSDFIPKIMAIGGGEITEVEKKVNDQVDKMKQSQNQNQSPATPSPDLTNPIASQVADQGVDSPGK